MVEPSPTTTGGDRGAQPSPPGHGILSSLGAVGAAFLASLCCIGPLLFVTLGVGAGLASTFEPLRPVFVVLTIALLAVGFYVTYGRRSAEIATTAAKASDPPDGNCAVPRRSTRDELLLWTATVIALALLTFPQWSKLLV
ncbi:MAG: mercuric ion transporter MerT [Gemmatimonadaceae bacterium]